MHTMKRFQTHLPEPMLKRLEEIAKERDYSVAEIIRSMLQKQIEEYDRSKKECG
jgi:metal-responsive CopG/Arc/MetJ family transcriptional regulator